MAETENKEIAIVKAQATKAVAAANDIVIASTEDMVKATDVLSKIKTVAKLTKERKELITKPLMESLNSVRELFKPIELNCTEAERIIKGKMVEWMQAEDKRIAKAKAKVIDRVESGKISTEKAVQKMDDIGTSPTTTIGKVGQVSMRTVKKYRVTDESKLPREYLMPDMSLITAALNDGIKIPGAEVYEEKVISAR